MSVKLSQSERRDIITDHLNGIPNELYYVITTSTGTYQVRRKKDVVKEVDTHLKGSRTKSEVEEVEEVEEEVIDVPEEEEYEEEEEKPYTHPKGSRTKSETPKPIRKSVKRQRQAEPDTHPKGSSITNDQVLLRLKEMIGDTPTTQRSPVPRRRVLRL